MTKFGKYLVDDNGMPCFDVNLQATLVTDFPFKHLISTGRLSAMADQWGSITLFTTEGGYTSLVSNKFGAWSGIYPMIEVNGDLFSLIFDELDKKISLRYGIGYVEYSGEIRNDKLKLFVKQEFLMTPERKPFMIAYFIFRNIGAESIEAQMILRSDVLPIPASKPYKNNAVENGKVGKGFAKFKNLFLISENDWKGNISGISLELRNTVKINPGDVLKVSCSVGYGKNYTTGEIQDYIRMNTPHEIRGRWKEKLSSVDVKCPEKWMKDECTWSVGQLLSFTCYDNSVDEYYVNLGGYGWKRFAVREDCETALALAYWDPPLAKSSLRWVAKTQLSNGDIPKDHEFKRDKTFSSDFESDTEIWFILGCCEYIKQTRDYAILDEKIPFWKGETETLWIHLKRAYQWILNGIGPGPHGLILIKDGDWNDYLSQMGRMGRGESVMNSAMACRAFDDLAKFAKMQGDREFHEKVTESMIKLRKSVSSAFDKDWFIRGYTDEGKPVGTYSENRLFINAQSWAALGRCGTEEQQKQALLNAVERCHTDIGMTLVNKPYSCPPPANISRHPIPAGEGENGGIWPQTVYWMIWALAEAGLTELALKEWKAISLRNHSRLFPDVPYGIFNGPDCYSSKYAGKREGRTQIRITNRVESVPMNPIVAWQAFAMKKINEARI